MMNMSTAAQASLAIARATALTPSFRATLASTCHPEKHTWETQHHIDVLQTTSWLTKGNRYHRGTRH